MKDYVAVLKHLTSQCKFSDSMRNVLLRGRLVSGIRDDKMLSDLFKENLEDLTFKRAVTKCRAHKQANKDVHALQGGGGWPKRMSVRESSFWKSLSHRQSRSAAESQISKTLAGLSTESEQQCSRCGELHDPKTPVKTLECSDDKSSSSDLNHLSNSEKREPICVDLALEGTPFRMEIDTGAAVSVVGEASYQNISCYDSFFSSRIIQYHKNYGVKRHVFL